MGVAAPFGSLKAYPPPKPPVNQRELAFPRPSFRSAILLGNRVNATTIQTRHCRFYLSFCGCSDFHARWRSSDCFCVQHSSTGSRSLVSLAWLCSSGSTKWAMVFMFVRGAGVRGCDWPSPMEKLGLVVRCRLARNKRLWRFPQLCHPRRNTQQRFWVIDQCGVPPWWVRASSQSRYFATSGCSFRPNRPDLHRSTHSRRQAIRRGAKSRSSSSSRGSPVDFFT